MNSSIFSTNNIVQNSGRVVKTLANQPFQSFGKENFGKFTIAILHVLYSYLGKILVNDIHDHFAKFAKVFPTRIW